MKQQIGLHDGFKHKVLKSFRLAILIGLAVAFFGLSFNEYKSNELSLFNNIQVLGDIFGNRSVAALVFHDKAAAEKNLSTARFQKSIDVICLYNKTGQLFAKYAAQNKVDQCSSRHTYQGEADSVFNNKLMSFTIIRPVHDKGETFGHISLYCNKTSIYSGLLRYSLTVLLSFALVWLIMTYVVRRAVTRIMQPLEALYVTAKDIAEHKLHEKRATKQSSDEIGELVDAFNKMLDSIAQENMALVQSEVRFRTLSDNSPVGVFQRDITGSLLYANDKWYELTCLTPETGMNFEDYILDTYKLHYRKNWKSASAVSGAKLTEFAYKAPNGGGIRSFMEYISALYDSANDIQGYIGTLVDVTELKNAQIELEKLAFYDPLTSLPNRRFYRDHLNYLIAEVKRSKTNIAVMMLDLDNFKKVNDTLGHDSGDHLLKIISERMHFVLDQSCVISRMGGDEFMFLLPDATATSAANIAQLILESVNEPIHISGHTLEISGSMGVSIFPNDGQTSHDLIKNADMALYHAKDIGKNQIKFYSLELDNQIKETMRLESKLVKAVKNEEFSIHLQPLFSTKTETIIWAEALLRWQDKLGHFISPVQFIPLAENLGIIHKLSRLVLKQVCYCLGTHHQCLLQNGIKGISINLSALEFYSRDFLPEVKDIIKETRTDPCSLEFEITESVVMDDTEKAIDIMRSLRELGCRLSIDDFGTGYSSLSYLKRFPITALKIDQSFVSEVPHDANDVEICTAIIAMAHNLGIEVIAEGVENTQQRDFLIDQGCEYLQGFLIARPQEISRFVTQWQRSVSANEPKSG